MDDKTKVVSEGEQDYIALPSGFRLGKYELQAVLGQGGFGITYRAWDRELDRPVAIKEYLPSDTAVRVDGSTVKPRSRVEDESFAWGLTRFLDEARALARFEHAPAIVRVYDYMAANGTAYMVMALVDGAPLSGIYRREAPLDEARLKAIVLPLLQGLEQVHAAGFLHRDIKPANILIRRDGNPVLIDFGAARQAVGEKSRSVTSVFTPGYAPFEQYMSSGKQGPWTDIYALAATLYHGITGKVPPQATDRIRDDDMEPAVRVGAGRYSPEFLAAIDAGLTVFETARPQSVAQWRAMLLGQQAADANTMPLAGAAMTAGGAAGPSSMGGPASRPSQAPPLPSQGGPISMAPPSGPPANPSLGPGSTQMPSQGPNSYAPNSFAPVPRKRTGLWLGLGVLAVAVLAGGGYAAYSSLQSDRQSIEARLKAEEDARLKAEDDARKKAVEAAELRVREEERQKAAAAAAAAEAKRKADEEAQRQAAAAAAAAEAKRKADDEAQRQAAAAAAAAEAKRKADEAARLKAEEDARKKAEADKKKADDDARHKAEEDARKKAEADKKKAEDDARRKAEEEERRKAAVAKPPAPVAAAAPAPQVASAPAFAYAGVYTLVIDCPNVQSPPFVSHPLAINGPNIAERLFRNGVANGTITGNTLNFRVSFTGRSGDHFDGVFTLAGDGAGFKGVGKVVGFSRGFPERTCPISILK